MSNLLQVPPSWRAPATSSPRWHHRILSLKHRIGNWAQLPLALSLTLRFHLPRDAVSFDLLTPSTREQVTVPIQTDQEASGWSPIPHPPLRRAAVALSTIPSSSAVDVAVIHQVPIIISNHSTQSTDMLEISYDTGVLNSSMAGWLLIHLGCALVHVQSRGWYFRQLSFIGIAEDYILGSDSGALRYEQLPQHFHPPDVDSLHDVLRTRAAFDPLAPAIWYPDSRREAQVSYFHVIESALQVSDALQRVGVAQDVVVPIRVDSYTLAAITMVGILICGASYLFLPSDTTLHDSLASAMSAMHNIPVVISASQVHMPAVRVIHPESLLGKEDIDSPPVMTTPPAMAHDYLDRSAFISGIRTSDDLQGWTLITHHTALEILRNRYERFGQGSSMRIAQLGGPIDEFMGMNIWEAFMHGASFGAISAQVDAQPVASILKMVTCTHLVVSPQNSDHHLSRVLEVLSEGQQGTLGVSKLVLVNPPSEPMRELVSRLGLQWMAHNADPKSCAAPPQKPITILITPENEDKSLTPSQVLNMIPQGRVLHALGTHVVKITDDLVVKYGSSVCAAEAQVMIYVRQQTKIPVPAVHLVFSKGLNTYIVMQYICGHNLQGYWKLMNASKREKVATQLSEHLQSLHSLSSPNQVPGPIGGGRCVGPWFTFYGAGPFKTKDELIAWLNRKLGFAKASSVRSFTADHPLVLTHQDISPRNLILDHSGMLWIIDWELAGWYPAFFEYACIALDAEASEAPRDWAGTILPRIPDYSEHFRALNALAWVLDVMPFS